MRRRNPRAREPPDPFGAHDPPPQLAAFSTRQPNRKGVIGRLQQMMAFVEYIAGRHGGIVEPAERGLRHDKSVIGDDDPGIACAADILLDKATTKMLAGGMDALAAAVGEAIDATTADQFGKPAGEIAGDQITRLVARIHRATNPNWATPRPSRMPDAIAASS